MSFQTRNLDDWWDNERVGRTFGSRKAKKLSSSQALDILLEGCPWSLEHSSTLIPLTWYNI